MEFKVDGRMGGAILAQAPPAPKMDKKNDIQLLRVNYLRGPNLWTYRSALETWLDLGELEDLPSNKLPGLTPRLCAWLPALVEHHCGVGERGGFLQRLQEGTWCGHVLEHVVIELLNLAGMPTGFGQTRSTSRHGVYRMVFRARDEQVARTALAQGHRLLMCAINDEPFDVAAAVAAVRDKLDDCYLGPSTAAIVAAATDRRIPHIRLNDGNLVQLGHGERQRRIWTAETDLTSAIAEGIARDKDLTKRLLKSVRRAGARGPAGGQPGRSLGSGAGHRPAGGRQAHRRQPRPRRHARPEHPVRGRGRLGAGRPPWQRGDGRALRARRRAPAAGGRRRGGGGRARRDRLGHRRRPSHGAPS